MNASRRTASEVFETVPRVSMVPKHVYKVATATYDRLLDVGPLTDEAILAYEARGRYGEARQRAARALLDARAESTAARMREALERAKRDKRLKKSLEAYE
jgi:hypothetical protein